MNYFITSIYDKPGIFIHRKARRTFGYFHSRKEALKAVKENFCNINECFYNYVVIEGIGEGIHARVDEEYWFEWKDNSWNKLENKPELFNGIVNFALG